MSGTPAPVARLLAVLLAGALALTGCSGESDSAQQPSGDNTTEASPAPKRWPFTGETTARLPQRRAVAVKIENTDNGEPQSGVGSADLVVRELVEGGLTRLVAFYYSSLPSRVGPARSMRGTDIGIVQPAKAVLTGSGGHPKTMRRINKANVAIAREGLPGFFRVERRTAPYDLFLNLKQLPKRTLQGPRPPAYLPWGSAQGLGRGKPARRATVSFSGVTSTTWTWTGNHWRRSDSHAARGDDFRPENVLVLQAKQVDAGYRDPAGNPVPETVFAGRGPATLLHRGRAYEGAWLKRSLKSPVRLVSAKGQQMRVPPGHTWIELIPRPGGGVRAGR